MTTAQKMFDCGECGGPVRMATGAGRTYEYRPGITLPIPDTFPTTTCGTCGELYLTSSEAESLEQALELPFAEYCNDLVETACARAGVTLRELERAAGVTHTYLSKVRNGKQASLTLLRLLQAFARHPDEVRRNLAGGDYRDGLDALDLNGLELMRPVFSAEVPGALEGLDVDYSFEDRLPELQAATLRPVHRPRRTAEWNDDDNCIVAEDHSPAAMLDVA